MSELRLSIDGVLAPHAVALGIGVGGTMGITTICEWSKRN